MYVGFAMRYLRLIILFLAYSVISPAFADVCCPSGCVPTYAYNSTACVHVGTQNSCGYGYTCGGGSGNSSSGSSGRGGGQFPAQPGPQCISMSPTAATVEATASKCVNDLKANAQFFGCLFEDDAGRAEDKRTGLSCPDREAALAKLCAPICAAYANFSTHTFCVGQDPNLVWAMFFGRIGGTAYGSANVGLCGRLPTSVTTRVKQSPAQRYHF